MKTENQDPFAQIIGFIVLIFIRPQKGAKSIDVQSIKVCT